MDSLTHIVLGACIGEAIAGKQLGKKAMLMGAIANSLPDIDILGSLWLDHASDLLFHRGITHSFLFLAIASPLLAWGCKSWKAFPPMAYTRWLTLWGVNIFLHLFIDCFTAYGTGLFEPFSTQRFSFNVMFVLDPLFTLGPGAAFIALLLLKKGASKRTVWVKVGVGLSIFYTLNCFCVKASIEQKVKSAFQAQKIVPIQYFTTPTPVNNLLWYIVAATDSGYYVGYRSVFDCRDSIDLRLVKRKEQLLTGKQNETIKKLIRFSEGYYTVEQADSTLYFSDMRFGETGAWTTPHPSFIFQFDLQNPKANDQVLQKRRMAMMDPVALKPFWRRLWGGKPIQKK